MKIIGFSTGRVGREANIDRLVKAIMTASGYEAEFVKLTDYTYGGCKGCVQLCSHPQECKLDDAVSPFYHKLKEADAVVLGSPVYFSTVNASMLAFIERFFGYRHVTIPIKDKPFVLALSGGFRYFDLAIGQFKRALFPFAVNVVDVVCSTSGIPPCLSCGRHRECRIGGLYGAVGERALTLEIQPGMFRRWENSPEVCQAVQQATEKLKAALIRQV